jgi:hypothetical protein
MQMRGLSGLILVLACSEPRIVGAGGPGTGGGPGGSAGASGTQGGGGSSGAAGGGGVGGGFAVPDANFTFGAPDGGADYPAPNSVDATCGFQKYKLERVPPELLLLLDRSSSMQVNVEGSANSRWMEATAALTDVLGQTNGTISWGMKSFPLPEGCDVQPGVEVPIGASTTPVTNAIRATMPNQGSAGTPTAETVTVATAYMRTRTSASAKYLVLATDGEPTCPGDNPEAATIAALSAAKSAGFATFVIGIATAGTDADRILSEMATAGGVPRAAVPPYYPVANRRNLVDALGQIAKVVASCSFPLDKDPPSPNDVAVNVDGMRVMRDPAQASGWNYGPGNRVITLYGAACDRVKSGQVEAVDIIFGCPNVPIP